MYNKSKLSQILKLFKQSFSQNFLVFMFVLVLFCNKQSGVAKKKEGVKGKTIQPEKELGLNERQFNFYFHSTPTTIFFQGTTLTIATTTLFKKYIVWFFFFFSSHEGI